MKFISKLFISLTIIMSALCLSSCEKKDTLDEIYKLIDNDFIEKTEQYFYWDSDFEFILADKEKMNEKTYNLLVLKLHGYEFDKAIIIHDIKYNEFYLGFDEYSDENLNQINEFYDDNNYTTTYRFCALLFNKEWFISLSFPHFYEKIGFYEQNSDIKYVNTPKLSRSFVIGPNDLNIERFTMPNELSQINDYAFQNCKSLKSVVCGYNLETIHQKAFENCTSLESVKTNDKLLQIGNKAFYNCSSLDYIILPSTVEYVGYLAFNYGNIYCEHKYYPSSWDRYFYTGDAKVYWKGEWEYNSEGIPQPIAE